MSRRTTRAAFGVAAAVGMTVVSLVGLPRADALSTSPTVTAVQPPTGSPAGGQWIDLHGSGLLLTDEVAFGGYQAVPFQALSDSDLLVQTPSASQALAYLDQNSTPDGGGVYVLVHSRLGQWSNYSVQARFVYEPSPPSSVQVDPAHSGDLANGGGPSLSFAWSDPMQIEAPPVVGENRVYVVYQQVDASGVYHTYLSALNPTTGQPVWGPIFATPDDSAGLFGIAYDAGRVYVAGGSGWLCAYNAATGQLIWSLPPPVGNADWNPDGPTVIAADGLVYLDNGGILQAYDGTTPNVLWQYPDGYTGIYDHLAWTQQGLYDNTGSQLSDLDPLTRAIKWQAQLSPEAGVGTPNVASGQVLVPGSPTQIYDSGTGALLAETSTSLSSAYAGSDRFTVFNNTLAAYDNKTQAQQWSFAGDSQLVGTPVIVGSRLYVGSSDGQIYSVDPRTGAPLEAVAAQGRLTDCASCGDPISMNADSLHLYVPTESGLTTLNL